MSPDHPVVHSSLPANEVKIEGLTGLTLGILQRRSSPVFKSRTTVSHFDETVRSISRHQASGQKVFPLTGHHVSSSISRFPSEAISCSRSCVELSIAQHCQFHQERKLFPRTLVVPPSCTSQKAKKSRKQQIYPSSFHDITDVSCRSLIVRIISRPARYFAADQKQARTMVY